MSMQNLLILSDYGINRLRSIIKSQKFKDMVEKTKIYDTKSKLESDSSDNDDE